MNIREQLALDALTQSTQGRSRPADPALEEVPQWAEYFWADILQDGRPLDKVRLSITGGNGDYEVTVSDGALDRSTSLCVSTWADILPAVQRAVLSAETRWKVYRKGSGKLRAPKPSPDPVPEVNGAPPRKKK